MVFLDTLVLGGARVLDEDTTIEGKCSSVVLRWANYLEQARTLAEFRAKNRSGRNYRVPLRVSRVEYCVCTPLAENIQSPGASYWLDDETPRICVPQEPILKAPSRAPYLHHVQ